MLARLRKLLDNRWVVSFLQDRSIREAAFVFLLTRTLILFVMVCVGQLTVYTYPDGYDGHDANISFEHAQIARKLRTMMSHGDVAHYYRLATRGYRHAPFEVDNEHSQQFAFFPLLPILLYLLRFVTDDVILWAAGFSNLIFFLALVLLYKLTLAFDYDESVARRTLFYLAAFPVSYFFSVPLTESLFVFLTVGSFYAARREHWWLAALCGVLASATRVTGILLLPALVVLSWQMYRSIQVRKILWLLLIPLGPVAYSFYCWRLSGDALAFKHAQVIWGRHTTLFFLAPIIKWVRHPHPFAETWNFYLLHVITALMVFVCIYILARRREWAFAVYTFMSIVVPLSSGSLQSMERYTMGFFPVFIALAIAGESERTDQIIRFVFVFLLAILTTLFAANFTNALS